MSEKNHVSRLIRDRAMAILRDTRAKIDPSLLAAMKDHLSAVMPGGAAPAPVNTPPAREKKFVPPVMEEAHAPPEHEAVDKQKIAQIVMNYMKNRDDKQKH